jgi:hypothetical protein
MQSATSSRCALGQLRWLGSQLVQCSTVVPQVVWQQPVCARQHNNAAAAAPSPRRRVCSMRVGAAHALVLHCRLQEDQAEKQLYSRRLEAKLEELQSAADLSSRYAAAKQKVCVCVCVCALARKPLQLARAAGAPCPQPCHVPPLPSCRWPSSSSSWRR